MKNVLTIFMLVIVAVVISTSGCTIDPADDQQYGEVDHSINHNGPEAENIVIEHVKARMAELSSTLSFQVDRSWITDSHLDHDSSYTFNIHAPGVGAMVPDFEVYLDYKTRNISDNLPSDWAAQSKSYTE